MPYIKYIAEYINNELDAFLKQFGSKKIVAIAQSLPRQTNAGLELLPSYVDEDGEAQYVGPDDEFDYIGYHRVNSVTVGKANLNKYGDARGINANVVKMSYVVFGRRDQLKLTNDELSFYLQINFPEAADSNMLKQLQLRACNINITDIILNDLQVFTEEFQRIDFFLKPEQYLLKVNYTIESAFDRRCFNIC